MKTGHNNKSTWTRHKERPADTESQSQLKHLLVLSQWLLVIPAVMLLLFSCGQIGILTSRKIAESDTQTNIEADYRPWSYVLIHALKPEIIEEIIHDKPQEDGESGAIPNTSDGNTSWVNTTPNATSFPELNPTTKPTAPANNQPTPSDTPQQSPSPQITATPTTAPTTTPVDHSPTPTHTNTEITPITATPSPINPPSTEPVIFWMSSVGRIRRYRLVTSQPNGTPRQDDTSVTYITDPLTEGSLLEGGESTIHLYATNPSDLSTTVDIILEAAIGHRSSHIGDTEITIPPNTTSPTLFEKTFSSQEYTFSTIGTLSLTVSSGIQVTIYWDGEWNDARLVVPPITQ